MNPVGALIGRMKNPFTGTSINLRSIGGKTINRPATWPVCLDPLAKEKWSIRENKEKEQ